MQFANLSDLHAGRPKLAHNDNITNNIAVGVNGGGSSALTFDANGNMTSDGRNTFAWDVESRLIKISYPGTNNFTDFAHDALARRVKIVETANGSVTSTKNFVWSYTEVCEERNGIGGITKQFFDGGQRNATTDYHYIKDHLGSIREMDNDSGSAVAAYCYDPFGRATTLTESIEADVGFTGRYRHSRSGLNLTFYRAYSPSPGRWLNRDPLEESDGSNLYDYVGNDPIAFRDLLGSVRRRSDCDNCKARCNEFHDMGILEGLRHQSCLDHCEQPRDPDCPFKTKCECICYKMWAPWPGTLGQELISSEQYQGCIARCRSEAPRKRPSKKKT